MENLQKSWVILGVNTTAFTICFACWMLNGVLVTFLVENDVFPWDAAQMGMLIGIPILTGALMRLPLGLLTDRFGGRTIFTALLILSALPMYLLSYADSYSSYLLCSLGFGMTGASFAVGVAYSAVWFPKEKQGTALGLFGVGNVGAGITVLGAPSLLLMLTNDGQDIDKWRELPIWYAGLLIVTGILFYAFTENKKPEGAAGRTLKQMLNPLREVRVWRFGLYYFLVFGGFVSLAQWLVPYYVNVYGMTIVMAGLVTSLFSMPSGLVRAIGGMLADRFGARTVMYVVLGLMAVSCVLLLFPTMDIETPGPGIMARQGGTVTKVTDEQLYVDDVAYKFKKAVQMDIDDSENHFLPIIYFWQEPIVQVGSVVSKKQLLIKGVTHVYFQANVWIFTFIVFVLGSAMGVGMAAVYKYIPDYFPDEIGAVGGMVGVIGGLGGFVCPIIFGYLLKSIGLWTTTWVFFFAVTMVCLIWLHIVVRRISAKDTRIE